MQTSNSAFDPLRRARVGAAVLAIGGALTFSSPQPALAALGGPDASVAMDHAVLRGTLSVTPMQAFDVHRIAGDGGQTVREYATRQGRIFAVTWHGPRSPDLKLLLGAYFDRYVAAAKLQRTGHHLLSIRTPELVMTVVRFQRSASGQAYVPALMPRGVTRAELR